MLSPETLAIIKRFEDEAARVMAGGEPEMFPLDRDALDKLVQDAAQSPADVDAMMRYTIVIMAVLSAWAHRFNLNILTAIDQLTQITVAQSVFLAAGLADHLNADGRFN